MRVSLLSLGCKVNQAEISLMEGTLKNNGFEIVGLHESPQLCIINTCTVTSKSDYQSRQLIRRAHKAGAKVAVTGCYSELNKDSVRAMPEVKDIIDNKDKLNYINNLVINSEGITLEGIDPMKASETASPMTSRTRLALKVQDGCNSSCTYCIIPKARGSSRSLNIDSVVAGVKSAHDSGHKEVVLTGIHLGIYGHDLVPSKTLSELVSVILNRTPIERIRLSSIEVTEIDDRLISLFENNRLCSHLHIPMQSGDARILKLMNRDYDRQYYINKIRSLYSRLSHIAIGTDVIAGFPGEGDKEFMNTFNLLKSLPFSYIHVFPFSGRKGTPAFLMPDNVKDSEKKKRCGLLRALSDKKKRAYMLMHIGKTLDVLIEETLEQGLYLGTSSNYLKVTVMSGSYVKGSLVRVRIEKELRGMLAGNPV